MKQEWLSGAALPTLDLIAPHIEGADDWKFFQDTYASMSDQSRCTEATYGVSEGRYGGYDGWLIVQFKWTVLSGQTSYAYEYVVYRVVGSFIFEVEF
jgi:hypothetical protein